MRILFCLPTKQHSHLASLLVITYSLFCRHPDSLPSSQCFILYISFSFTTHARLNLGFDVSRSLGLTRLELTYTNAVSTCAGYPENLTQEYTRVHHACSNPFRHWHSVGISDCRGSRPYAQIVSCIHPIMLTGSYSF